MYRRSSSDSLYTQELSLIMAAQTPDRIRQRDAIFTKFAVFKSNYVKWCYNNVDNYRTIIIHFDWSEFIRFWKWKFEFVVETRLVCVGLVIHAIAEKYIIFSARRELFKCKCSLRNSCCLNGSSPRHFYLECSAINAIRNLYLGILFPYRQRFFTLLLFPFLYSYFTLWLWPHFCVKYLCFVFSWNENYVAIDPKIMTCQIRLERHRNMIVICHSERN